MRRYARDLRTLPADVVEAYRRDSVAGIWAELRARTLDRVYRRWSAVVIEWELAGMPALEPPPGVEIRWASPGDWLRLAPLAARRVREHFAQLAERGRRCLVAWRGDRPVGYLWVSRAVEPEWEGCRLPLPADAIYLFHVYVARAERGRGIARALESAVFAAARRDGLRIAWGAIEPRNRASWSATEAATARGFHLVGRVEVLKLGRRHRTRFRPPDRRAQRSAATSSRIRRTPSVTWTSSAPKENRT